VRAGEQRRGGHAPVAARELHELHRLDRVFGVEPLRLGEEPLGEHGDLGEEPALVAGGAERATLQSLRPQPLAAVQVAEQLPLLGVQFPPPRGLLLGAGHLALHADEPGLHFVAGVAVLVEPVGEHEPRGVLVRVRQDRGEKGFVVGHAYFTSSR
jgi:hypothetical protein